VTPDALTRLEEERRFLLESIRDLDRERAAGDVDDSDHVALRDGAVARAAAVMREIESGRAAMAARPPRPWWRPVIIVAATLAVGVALGVAVSRFAGERLPGQTLTGGQEIDEVAGLLSKGRSLLNTDLPGALDAYRAVLEIEPDNAEARTYSAWLIVLNGRQSGDQGQIVDGMLLLQDAGTLDPSYADPHCLLAVAAGRFLDPVDEVAAQAEAQVCLDSNPPADMVPMIEGLLSPDTALAG
jgi:hypothetical protein